MSVELLLSFDPVFKTVLLLLYSFLTASIAMQCFINIRETV